MSSASASSTAVPTRDMVDAVLEGAAALAEGEFAPLDRIGDTVGARWDDGVVTHARRVQGGLCGVRRGRLDEPGRARGAWRAGAAAWRCRRR